MENIQSFEDLDCWRKAREFRILVNRQIIDNLPSKEKFRLSDQMIRASRSITNNIAEGYGKRHYKDKAKYINQAKGSVFELIDHVIIYSEHEYCSLDELNAIRTQGNELIKVLNGFERYLRSR